MQKQEISNIINFFVTQDSKGAPRQLEIHLIERSMDGKSTVYRIPPTAKGNVQALPHSKPSA